ncbi:cytosine deaminase [Acetobacter tropicalis NRIC 0312]|uniref:5-methylthioadenosine/S-adenosylhomocysteine deaminase n=1 Tax=Acetobacter tropicalis TaxID=104102 RepID=A0A511FRU3_9PROT|nr:amidohydrolase family protein [Acetobacter tropicalis]GAL98789.1 amidohydrolase [Acetobacter tropicalis]GBR70279.1 cytosine deaminase [Acetobacter tropicalis NRIC 0312]GEL51676.1 5-methylthioadenosine/S-adenosylhomocysteine deaminase [Acetobacter tropicalis]
MEHEKNIDILIKGCDIVTFDKDNTVLRDGYIAIKENKILCMGSKKEFPTKFIAKETIEASGMIAMPGLVDGHYHTGQQLLRGSLAAIHRKHLSKSPHWKNYYIPFETGLTPEDVYYSGLVGYTSMISVGTTCFMEAGGPHPDEMARAASDVGIRGYVSLNTMDFDESIPEAYRMSTSEALKQNEALVRRWEKHETVKASLSLRQLIVSTEELRKGLAHLAIELDTFVHTHLSEGAYEVDYAMEQFHRRPTEYFSDIGLLNSRLHCAHTILMTNHDLEIFSKSKATACHCAFGNYGFGPHRFKAMLNKNIPVGLGTDGPGGRCTLDLFEVAHFAVLGQTLVSGTPYHSSSLGYEEALSVCIRNGAKIARLDRNLGCLAVGKYADIVLIGAEDHDQFPVVDPVVTISQNCNGRDVQTVIVNGKIIMKNREFLTIDIEKMRRSVSAQYQDLMKRYHTVLRENNTPY